VTTEHPTEDAPPDTVVPPDADAAARTRESGVVSQLGKLGAAAVWAAGVQGAVPPRPFRAPRVVVVAADHGVAALGVSASPAGASVRRARAAASGEGVYARLAFAAGATVRVADVGLTEGFDGGDVPLRRGSGVLGREDTLTAAEAQAAFDRGRAIADAEADAGVDLIVPAVVGVGASSPAAVVVAALCDEEPAAMTGRGSGSGIDDETWMRKCVAVRDGLRRARQAGTDPMALLAAAGGADLAAVAGLLLQAAVRRTPALLDGVTVLAAALVAREVRATAAEWWFAPHAGDDPAEQAARRLLGLEAVADLGLRLGDGTGALVVLPLLHTVLDLPTEDG
jgi:nicotinate-nucleotide--dimethylbenzimidazole phosphoribosyltransferase